MTGFRRGCAGGVLLNLLLLVGLSGLLGAGGLVWLDPQQVQAVDATSSAGQGDIPPAGLERAGASFIPMGEIENYQEIVARPLFFQARRPPEKKTDEPVAAPVAPAEEQELTLIGVMGVADRRTALVHMQTSGKTSMLKIGDSLDGWRVESIDTDAVDIVSARGENRRLALVRNKRKPSQRISKQSERLRRLREIAAQRDEAPSDQPQDSARAEEKPTKTALSDADGEKQDPEDKATDEPVPAPDAAAETGQTKANVKAQARDPAAELRQDSRAPKSVEQAPKK